MITNLQRVILTNVHQGREPDMNRFGLTRPTGMEASMRSLRRRGLLAADDAITPAGLAELGLLPPPPTPMTTKIYTEATCAKCGQPMMLECVGHAMEGHDKQGALDLILECKAQCGSPTLNAFVPVSDFIEVT